MIATIDENKLTEIERKELVGVLAAHLGAVDPEGKGMRVRDIAASYFPPTPGDGRERLRAAMDKLTRARPGRPPDIVRLAKYLAMYKNAPLPGGFQIQQAGIDRVGTKLWTAVASTSVTAPQVAEQQGPVPKRRAVADDPPGCRETIEGIVGRWLLDHLSQLPGAPAALTAVPAAAYLGFPGDLALPRGAWVLVQYTKDITPDQRLRLPTTYWNALGLARRAGDEVFLCFCNDRPGLLSFDPYDHFTADFTQDADGLWWPAPFATRVADFKPVVPHIQSIRATRHDVAGINRPMLNKYQTILMRNEPDLLEAVKRGWLYTEVTGAQDEVARTWALHCEAERMVDLHVCMGMVRLDVGIAGLSFSETQLSALLDKLRGYLTAEQREPLDVATTRVVSFQCLPAVASTLGAIVYEHALALRPKRLGPSRGPSPR
jgi:hypothetical protein